MLKPAALALSVVLSTLASSPVFASEPFTFPAGTGWKECPVKNRKGMQPGCVHDGDTFWYAGAKYRLACIDAVELTTNSGPKARDMLVTYLNKPGTKITDIGTRDRYKRHLVIVPGFDREMIASGLAVDPRYRDARAFCRKIM